MKKLLFILTLLLCTIPLLAENTVGLSSVSGNAKDMIDMRVSLTNTDEVAVAEVKIPLNNYLKYVDGSCELNTERGDDHQLSAGVVNDTLRVYIYGLSGKVLKGNSGTLFSFQLRLGSSHSSYTLLPRVILGGKNGSQLSSSATAGVVTILAPNLTLGATSISYGKVAMRGKYSKNVVLKNTGTQTLTVNDVHFSSDDFIASETAFTVAAGASKTLTVTYSPAERGAIAKTMEILSDADNGVQRVSITAEPYSVNVLKVGNASGEVEDEVTVDITLDNMEPITAVQFDIALPSQLEYVEGSLSTSERSSDLSAIAYANSGKLTMYMFSPSNKVITGESGTIATFRLKLVGRTGTYKLTPNGVILGNVTEENMVSGTGGGTVTISSPIFSGASTLSMGREDVTKLATASYNVKNSGKVALVIKKVVFLSEEDYGIAEHLPITIESGTTKNITVQHKASTSGSFSTTMQLYTNDPETRVKSITVNGSTYEPNSFALDGRMTTNGYQLDVQLNNYTQIVASQLDIHVPEGITISTDEVVKTSRLEGMSFTLSDMGNGVYRAVIFSLSNQYIQGNEGTVFSCFLHGEIPFGQAVTLSDVIQGTKDGQNFATEFSAVHILERPTLGDINLDTKVNISDLAQLIDAMKDESASKDLSRYDINMSGDVTTDDIEYLGALILDKLIPISQLSFDNPKTTMTVGESAKITVQYLPENAEDTELTWQSSNTEVATVSSDGVVTAVSSGVVTITAIAHNGVRTSVSITVQDMEKLLYIENTGNAQFVLDYIYGASTRIEIKLAFTNSNGGSILGENGNSDNNDLRFFPYQNTQVYFDWGSGRIYNYIGSSALSSVNTYELGNYYIKMNGNTICSSSKNSNVRSKTMNLFPSSADRARVYYFKIYEGSDLKRSFIPVLVSNEYCLYEEVEGKYYKAQYPEKLNGKK